LRHGDLLGTDPGWEVRYMRRQGADPDKYVFDKVESIAHKTGDIVTILSSPKIIRRVYHFRDDFRQFASRII